MENDRTRTLLFGIFVTTARPLTASQICRLAAPLGISSNNVKSHLTRLVAEGALDRSGPVRLATYAPSRSQATLVEGIEARLRTDNPENHEAWDGGWLMLAWNAPRSRTERERIRAALWFDGFRPVSPRKDTYVRPAWPKQWAVSRAQRYEGTCMYGRLLEPIGRPKFDAMYSLEDFEREAKTLARWVSQRRRPTSNAHAFALLLDVGGRLARLIAHDPRLPPVLWGNRAGLTKLIQAYRKFERRVRLMALRFVEQVTEDPPRTG